MEVGRFLGLHGSVYQFLRKREASLGFKDLYCFNLALLGKQAWRVLTNPHSLLSRLYKGRYHINSMFLDSGCGTSPSYGWRSIQAGKALLKRGLQVRLGNGQDTYVKSDNWLPVLPLTLVHGVISNDHLKVADLWTTNKRECNDAALAAVLTPEDAAIAKSIRLSRYAYHDTFIWPYTTNTQYTVRSGYWVATHVVPTDEIIEPPNGSLELKKEVWTLPIAPKIKHFLWKAITGVVPTATRLQSKIPTCDPICQRCCLQEETINHVLFKCSYAQAVWRCANFRCYINVQHNLEENFWEILQMKNTEQYPSTTRLSPFWLVWIIWKSRNEFLFRHRDVHPKEDAYRALHAVEEWVLTHPWPRHRRSNYTVSTRWEPPPLGWLKCNFDSTFQANSDYMGVGWLVRNANGEVLEAGWARLQSVCSSLQAEANIFLYMLQRIWSRGWRQVWFEGDNLELTNIINRRDDSMLIGNLLSDIRFWIAKLPWCSLAHINREKNQASDCLAKMVYKSTEICHVYNVPPP